MLCYCQYDVAVQGSSSHSRELMYGCYGASNLAAWAAVLIVIMVGFDGLGSDYYEQINIFDNSDYRQDIDRLGFMPGCHLAASQLGCT